VCMCVCVCVCVSVCVCVCVCVCVMLFMCVYFIMNCFPPGFHYEFLFLFLVRVGLFCFLLFEFIN
jgi:hypothetical protein